MQQRYLILKGIAGLGNRLGTLANAIDYARRTERILFVDWSDGVFGLKGDNVFQRYFRLNDVPHAESFEEISADTDLDCYPPAWSNRFSDGLYDLYFRAGGNFTKKIIPHRVLKGTCSKLHNYWHSKDDDIDRSSDLQAVRAVFDKKDIPFGGSYRTNIKQKILFFADFYPRFSPDVLRKNILLADLPDKEVNNAVHNLGLDENTVGVHIRMTDKQPKAPLERLFEKIAKLPLRRPKIFLATDCAYAEEQVMGHFRDVILVPKRRPKDIYPATGLHLHAVRSGDYSFAETVLMESITDMWLLSKCEYLIYQKNSSFSQISAVLKNQPAKTFAW